LLWQLYKHLKKEGVPTLYFSLDQLRLATNSTPLEIIENFSSMYPTEKVVLIDETTYFENWDLQLKIAYDNHPDTLIIATGFSALKLKRSPDLARRSHLEPLLPLSFSEYLAIKQLIPLFKRGTLKTIKESIFQSSPEEAERKLRETINYLMQILKVDPAREVGRYIRFGGFPFSALSKRERVMERVYSTLERIINRDLPQIESFEVATLREIERLIVAIATSSPGQLSWNSLSKNLGIGKLQLMKALKALEDSEVMFPIKPVGKGGRAVRKPWKYYFTTSTLRASIRWTLGFSLYSQEAESILVEESVGATLRKTCYIGEKKLVSGISYWRENHEIDFLLSLFNGRKIAVEVGTGKKKPSYTLKTVDADFKIIVSPSKLKVENETLYIPIWLFLMI